MKLQGQNITDTEGGDNRSHIFYLSCLAVLSPGVIIGLVSGWHSNMLKTFLRHPSFFVLPVFTPFTFTSSKKTCYLKDNEDEGHLRFSVKASLCNLFASFLTSVITFLSVALHNANQDKNFVIVENALFLFVPFSGSLLSLFFLYNARPTTNQFNCCCCSCEAAIEYGVYKPDSPAEHFVLRINADGSEEICLEVDQEEESMEMEQGDGEQDQLQGQGRQEEEDKHFDFCSNENGTEEYYPDRD